MNLLILVKRHKIITLFLLIVIGVILYWYLSAFVVNNRVKHELGELSLQEHSLQLPPPREHEEKEVGCTWSERQNWESDGCFMGLTDTYYEKGPERKAEQQITTSLLNHGWQKRQSDIIWDSEAITLYGNDGSFTKQTSAGRFCAGISYRYFSDDMQNGPRSVALYMLSPSDHGCSRW